MEWWEQDLEEKTQEEVEISSAAEAFAVSEKYGVPLHPDYTYMWHDLKLEEIVHLASYISANGRVEAGETEAPAGAVVQTVSRSAFNTP